MSEYATVEHYVNHVMGEITRRDVEQVSERLRALGWEEVVRCRDCKCFIPSGYCSEMKHMAVASGFCSWGERRQP